MQEPKNKSCPAVSVLIATFNNACYITAALDDILAQTFTDLEVVVVDDGSTDDTQRILSRYKDSRLVLLRNERRVGVAAARNRAMAASRAPLVAVADADDRYDRRRIEKQVRYIREHPEVDIVVSDFFKMNSEGRIFCRVKVPRTDSQIKFNFLWQCPISHSTAMCRRAAALRTGGYDESLSSAVDTDWFARMAEYATFGVIPEPLHSYRKHSSSISANHDPAQYLKRLWISHRQLCKYLQRDVRLSEGAALCELLCAYKAISPDDLDIALELLDELLQSARAREDHDTFVWARSRVATSVLEQSRNLSYVSAYDSRRLLREALNLTWRSAFDTKLWVQVGRLITARIRGKENDGATAASVSSKKEFRASKDKSCT